MQEHVVRKYSFCTVMCHTWSLPEIYDLEKLAMRYYETVASAQTPLHNNSVPTLLGASTSLCYLAACWANKISPHSRNHLYNLSHVPSDFISAKQLAEATCCIDLMWNLTQIHFLAKMAHLCWVGTCMIISFRWHNATWIPPCPSSDQPLFQPPRVIKA